MVKWTIPGTKRPGWPCRNWGGSGHGRGAQGLKEIKTTRSHAKLRGARGESWFLSPPNPLVTLPSVFHHWLEPASPWLNPTRSELTLEPGKVTCGGITWPPGRRERSEQHWRQSGPARLWWNDFVTFDSVKYHLIQPLHFTERKWGPGRLNHLPKCKLLNPNTQWLLLGSTIYYKTVFCLIEATWWRAW